MRLVNRLVWVCLLSVFSVQAESLKSVYLLAKDNDLTLSIAKREADIAAERIRIRRAQLLPEIGVVAGYNQRYERNKSEINLVSVNSDWQKSRFQQVSTGIATKLELFNYANWILLDISERAASQAMLAYYEQEQKLVYRVVESYFSVLRQHALYELNQLEWLDIDKLVKQSSNGSVAYSELLTRANQLIAERSLLMTQWQQSIANLAIITGQYSPLYNHFDLVQFKPLQMEKSLSVYLEQAQRDNLSILATKMHLDIARESIKAQQARHLPILTVAAGYQYLQGESFAEMGDSNATNINVTGNVGLSVPIYQGGAVSAEVEIAQHNYVIASQRLELIHRDITKATTDAYHSLNNSSDAITQYQHTLALAEETIDSTEVAVANGQRNSADLIDTFKQFYVLKSALVTAQFDNIIASVSLKLQLGQLSEQDVLDIDASL